MTKIEWTEKTLNVITGCTPTSEGCRNCYARKMHKRLTAMGQKKYKEPFENIVFHTDTLFRELEKLPKKSCTVFVNSMSDTFHEKMNLGDIASILGSFQLAEFKQHTYQVLTKRAHRLPNFEYPENVWLGITVELAKHKDRIEYLKQTDAKVKFLSCEPLLGDLGELDLTGIDWVIVGGESGHAARPLHPDWVRNIQRQCTEQGVPFFFKQWGEWQLNSDRTYITDEFLRIKTKEALLDGKEYKEYPQVSR